MQLQYHRVQYHACNNNKIISVLYDQLIQIIVFIKKDPLDKHWRLFINFKFMSHAILLRRTVFVLFIALSSLLPLDFCRKVLLLVILHNNTSLSNTIPGDCVSITGVIICSISNP